MFRGLTIPAGRLVGRSGLEGGRLESSRACSGGKAAMATTAADGLPVEPQSLKKLSQRFLKRSLDLFAPAHSLLFAPDAER
jgi:hypothetical protein